MARLQVSTNRLDNRIVIYGPRDWDQTPNIKVPREIDDILPDISRLVANEVSDTADMNVIRRVHYNLMSDREFDNDNFDRLVRFVCDLIELRIACREIRNPDDDLKESIHSAVLLHAVHQIDNYEELDDLVRDDRRLDRLAGQNLAKFKEIAEAIEEMHSGGSRSGSSRSSRDDRDRRGRDHRDDYDGRGGEYGGRDSRSRRDDRRDDRRDERRSGRNDRDDRERDRERRERERRDRDGRSSGRRERSNDREVSGMTDEHQDFVMADRKLTGRTEQREEARRNSAMPSSRDFIEDKDRPNTRALPEEVEETLKDHKLSGRSMGVIPAFEGIFGSIPYLQPTEGQTEMEMLQHAAVYGGVDKTVDFRKEAERVLTLATAIPATGVKFVEIEGNVVVEEPVETYGNVQTMLDTLSASATVSDIIDSGENTDGVRNIRHFIGIVDNAFPGYKPLNDFMVGFNQTKSLREIAAVFKRALTAVNSEANAEAGFATDIRAVIERYDRIITNELNTYCRDVLRVSDGEAIKSFMSDFDDLLSALQEGVSEELFNALLGFCTALAGNLTEARAPKLGIEAGVRAAYSEDDVGRFGIAVMPVSYLVTHIPFTIKELGYDIKSAVAISDNRITPFLRAALDISKTRLSGDDAGFVYPFRIVLTRDGTAYRLYQYPGERTVYVLTPLK